MENYLLDGRCSLSNNAAENAIRPFVTGRKNWLFADTPKGADASAAVYSLVETAKANGLDVFLYLQELLANMTDWDHTDEYLEDRDFIVLVLGGILQGTVFLSAYNSSLQKTNIQEKRNRPPGNPVLSVPLFQF